MTLIPNKDEKKSEYFRVIEIQICGGLDQYYCYKVIGQNYIECIKQHHQIHSELMVNFTRDLEKLRSMKLHLALQTNNWKCLMDFMSGGEVEEGCGDCCGNSQKKFEKKMLEFKQMRKVEEKLFAWRASAPIKNSSSIIEQKSVMQSLSDSKHESSVDGETPRPWLLLNLWMMCLAFMILRMQSWEGSLIRRKEDTGLGDYLSTTEKDYVY
ncbi:Autophagy-related protein 11 [Linum perenne]